MTNDLAQTFDALQLLEQGEFQELGDELLPWAFPELQQLKTHGLSREGKTRRGVPDSYVGPTPPEATVAVEYTTQADRLIGKLEQDYASAREKCPLARAVFLCSNREVLEEDTRPLREKAATDGVKLEVIDGVALARLLATDRQDIRQRHLKISIGAHTLSSLIARLADSVFIASKGRSSAVERHRLLPRFRLDVLCFERIRRVPTGTTFLLGDAGEGKSSWSIDYARRFAVVQPTIWLTALDLCDASLDPLGEQVALAAYGSADAARLPELGLLLRRERQNLVVFLDGADESRDYRRLERALRAFQTSVLGRLTHLVLCCRTEGAEALRTALQPLVPDITSTLNTLRIGPLRNEERRKLLEILGASQITQRAIENCLTTTQVGNPLFLEMALELEKAGALERAGPDLIATASSHFIQDICERLHDRGRTHTFAQVEQVLISVAERLSATGATGLDEDVARHLAGDSSGENSVISRALQTPLLVLAEGGLAFGHALFLEHFIERGLLARPDLILAAASDPRRADRAARRAPIATETTRALVALAQAQPSAACILLARGISEPAISDTAYGAIASLIQSRFPSDVRQGLHFLECIPSERSQKVAVEWFNGLSTEGRREWFLEAADLFFRLQVAGAAHMAAHAYPFRHTWFEPSSVRRIDGLDPHFRDALRLHAKSELEKSATSTRETCINILAQLRDDRLVDYLGAELERGLLDEAAHHALVFLNTTASCALYAKSIVKTLAARSTAEAGGSGEDVPRRLWDGLVPHTSDLVMLPHDKLLVLVRQLLASEDVREVAVGVEWSRLLRDNSLFEVHAAALHRFPDMLFAHTFDLGPLLASLSAGDLRVLFNSSDLAVKRALVHAVGDIPRPGLEEFLIERLAEPEFRFSAIQSLRRLGALTSAARVAPYLSDGDENVRKMAIRTLGILRYVPAAANLSGMLSAPADAEEEYLLVKALGSLGTADAIAALERHYDRARDKGHVLKALLRLGLESGIAAAERLTEDRTNWPLLVPSVARIGGGRGFGDALDGSGVPLQAHESSIIIRSALLLERVIQVARERLKEPTPLLDDTLSAVSRFADPQATEFLREIAERAPLSPESLDLRQAPGLRDPSLEAKSLLVSRGDERYAEEFLRRDLESMQRSRLLLAYEIQHLSRYPRQMVRAVVRESIDQSRYVASTLRVLSCFLEQEDRALLQSLEHAQDLAVADEAHRILAGMDANVG